MKIESSEENLPQVKQADIDVAAWEDVNADRTERYICSLAHLWTSFSINSGESGSFVL